MRIRYLKNTVDILAASPLVLLDQDSDPSLYKGRWREQFKRFSAPADDPRPSSLPTSGTTTPGRRLELEIGCGRGRFLRDMAAVHPNTLFIGNELVPTILPRTSERIRKSDSPVSNIRLIQMDALKLTEVFEKGEVDRIYLNFSDPWPKTKHHKRRLTAPAFLKVYAQILAFGQGDLVMKTDNDELFAFTLETLAAEGWTILYKTDDLHHSPMKGANVMTEYEENFLRRGKNIHYLRAVPCKN